jgi:nucleotide-binding universal stress UspA family protein
MYKKILVPLDGSELSEKALKALIDVATPPGDIDVILLEVVEPPVTLYVGGPSAISTAQEAQKQAKTAAAAYLSKLASRLKRKKLSVKTAVVIGTPADVILDYANQNRVDLIIMSTHGKSGISRWFFGSVAEKVTRHATIPVLISPPLGSRARR